MMREAKATTRFCGATSLHFVTVTAPLCRDPKLISNNMAAVLAMFDGLTLVCAAAADAEAPAGEPRRGANVDLQRDPN